MGTVRAVIAAVAAEGWRYDHTQGDHRVYKRATAGGIVVSPDKPGEDRPDGTLRRRSRIDKGIHRQAEALRQALDVRERQRALAREHLGDNGGTAEERRQILLAQAVFGHQ